jgi:adenylate cyclase
MSAEVEHKFLVQKNLWRPAGAGIDCTQGYLSSAKERIVRVRVAGSCGYLKVKGLDGSVTRVEFEYEIPLSDAVKLLGLCERPLVEKTRHTERHGEHDWDIDVFHGDNDGLVLAEVELATEREHFTRPPWLGAEVSDDPRYLTASLRTDPYCNWS